MTSLMKTAEFEPSSGWGSGTNFTIRRARQSITGLRVLLGAIGSLFFLMVIALLTRSQYTDWEPLTTPWNPLSNPWQLWLNTLCLVISSAALQWARIASRRQDLKSCRLGLLMGGGFAIGFLAGQLSLWQHLVALGYYVDSNPATSFFFMLTGIHGLHILGGMIGWGRTMARVWGKQHGNYNTAVEMCAIYWHFLLAIWMVLFALLASSPETFAAIAKMCGFGY